MASYYPMDDMFLNIARGLVKGTTLLHKFGTAPNISVDTTATIWDRTDELYPWSALDTEQTLNVRVVEPNNESNTSTALDGIDVTIEGLDDDFVEQTETVTISGFSATTTNKFRRINRISLDAEPATNTKRVLIRTENNTVVGQINDTENSAHMAIYTVPAGKTLFLRQGTMSCQAGADGQGEFFVRSNSVGEYFRDYHHFEVSGSGGQYMYEFGVPQPIPEKSDLDVRIKTRSNNGNFTAAYCGILIEENLGS